MELTRAHLRAARQAGACGEAVRRYKPGMSIHDVAPEHLMWIEENAPGLAAQCGGPVPLWAAGRSGFGDSGDGSGSGSGYGYGDGYGSGEAPFKVLT